MALRPGVRANRKLLEENVDEKPHIIEFDNYFLVITPKAGKKIGCWTK